MMRRPHPLLLLATVIVLGATPARAQSVTELYVSPDTLRLTPGSRQALTVQAFDASGNAILAFTFRSADSTIAAVASNGTVTAGRAGRTRLTVQAGQKTQAVTVVVTGGPAVPVAAAPPPSAAVETAVRLAAEPASLTLFPTERASITIRAFKADGTPARVPALAWRSLQPTIVAVGDSAGQVTGVAPGEAQLVAVGKGGSVSIPVTVEAVHFRLSADRLVMAPDGRDSLWAILSDRSDRPAPRGALQWGAADPGVIEVGPEGQVHALAPGHTEVIVRGFMQERRVPVIVHRRVARFLVAPRLSEPVRLALQGTREMTVLPQTADSIPVDGVPITWILADNSIADFDTATGILTARRSGSTTLTFAAPGFQPLGWTIEVLPGSVGLSATRVSLRPMERLQLTASFLDQRGSPVGSATGIAWFTSDAGVAKVAPDGTVQAVAPGQATITARAGAGQPSTTTVMVTGDLLLSSNRGGSFGIYALSAAAPEQFIPVVVDTSNSIDPAYSPDRTRLAYASDRGGNQDLIVADADGSHPVRLTTDAAPESQPAWTPDGRRLVFMAVRGGISQLYVINSAGGEARQLTSMPGGAIEPAVSPDGVTVAFTGFLTAREPQSDIYTIPLQGGTPTPITATRDRREQRPGYLPDGALTWLLQRKDRKEPDQVLQQPRAGIAAVPLFSTMQAVQDVALARDGSRIAWVASRPAEGGARNALEFTLQWRSLANGAETSIRLLPRERITRVAF